MKKLQLALIAAAFVAPAAFAQTTTGPTTFAVNLTLTPSCFIATAVSSNTVAATAADITLNYNAFQTSAAAGSTSVVVRCSAGLTYGVDLDAASVTDNTSGLAYTLELSASATPAATPAAVATLASQTGSATGNTVYVHANVGANQAGSSAALGAANNVRQITVTY